MSIEDLFKDVNQMVLCGYSFEYIAESASQKFNVTVEPNDITQIQNVHGIAKAIEIVKSLDRSTEVDEQINKICKDLEIN